MMIEQNLLEKFKLIIKNKKLTHLYLIEGGSNDEKKFFMFDLAYEFLKTDDSNPQLKKLIQNFSYPNFYYLNSSDNIIKKEQILEMKNYFSQTSLISKKKVYFIEKAEKLSYKAANSLLYFLENPINDYILGVLLVDNKNFLLSTIISRAQIFYFKSIFKHEDFNHKIKQKNKINQDSLDITLIFLLNNFLKRKEEFSKSIYYLELKKFWIFFLDFFEKSHDFKKLLTIFPYLIEEKLFLDDFLLLLTTFFLDLYYQKINLKTNFSDDFLQKKFFQNLSLNQIDVFLCLFSKIEQKNIFLEAKYCLVALMIELEKNKKNFKLLN